MVKSSRRLHTPGFAFMLAIGFLIRDGALKVNTHWHPGDLAALR